MRANVTVHPNADTRVRKHTNANFIGIRVWKTSRGRKANANVAIEERKHDIKARGWHFLKQKGRGRWRVEHGI